MNNNLCKGCNAYMEGCIFFKVDDNCVCQLCLIKSMCSTPCQKYDNYSKPILSLISNLICEELDE